MRTTLLSLLALFALALGSSTALAQDDGEDKVDTGKGLSFSKPSGWVIAPTKKGAVAAMYAAGDKRSQIEFRFSRVDDGKAKQYFTSFHGSLVGAGLQKSGEGEAKTYGKLQGKLSQYVTDGSTPMRLYVFEFSSKKGAWLIVGMFDDTQADKYLVDYEKLLTAVVVE